MAQVTTPPPDPFRAVRARLRAWRDSKGLKGERLHAVTGISPAFWSNIETGRWAINADGETIFKRPDGLNSLLIEALTDGLVRVEDWLTAEERRRLAKARAFASTDSDAGGAS